MVPAEVVELDARPARCCFHDGSLAFCVAAVVCRVVTSWWLAAGLAGRQRGEHTGLGEVLHENPREEACDDCAGDDGARYVDDCLDRFHVGVVDEDFVNTHEQAAECTGEDGDGCVPAAVAEDCEGDFSADALEEACDQDFAAPRAAGEEYGDERCDDFAEERGTGLADEQAAEGTAEQPCAGDDGAEFGCCYECGFGGGADCDVPDPEDDGAGYCDDCGDNDFVDSPA
ncbi:glutamate 5-kinase [Rothia mucilaginosa DY-18]|uniref:Glutamate 5-kinase n=1 Tax=Rothia mucilaginosa (strain DY-18) TaxID=680646 RepID=D2NPF8_ROTMD|nr:glutamate 5-kinase [Rothia mucilaginosa DY-18]